MSFRRWTQKQVIKLIEEVPFTRYALLFLALIFGSALIYYVLTPISHGIGVNGMPMISLTFWDALYFSVVTISSLGYGDMHPMGISKLVVGIQVLSGLFFMGIMLAKLTSARSAHHVSRLYGSELQKRMDKFCVVLENLEGFLMAAIRRLNDAFKEVPGKVASGQKDSALLTFGRVVSRFHSSCLEFKEYVLLESERGAFFDNVPKTSLRRAAISIDKNIMSLWQLIVGLPTEGRISLLDQLNRKRFGDIINYIDDLCCCVVGGLKDDDIAAIYRQLKDTCTDLPKNYYAVPEVGVQKEQPDQRVKSDDQPAANSTSQGK